MEVPYNRVLTWPQILQNEWRMMVALLSGLGLKQHKSPEYMQSLADLMSSITDDDKVQKALQSSQSAVRAWAEAERAARDAQRG